MTTTNRFVRTAASMMLAAGLIVGAVGCTNSDKGDNAAGSSTTVASSQYFKPPLPSGMNPIPFLKGDLVALGNVKIKVSKVEDPGIEKGASGNRRVTITTEVTNGSLDPLTLKPETFLSYVASGESGAAIETQAMTKPMISGETRKLPLQFEVPRKSPLVFVVFNGQPYGDRVNSGLIAVDPNYRLPQADN